MEGVRRPARACEVARRVAPRSGRRSRPRRRGAEGAGHQREASPPQAGAQRTAKPAAKERRRRRRSPARSKPATGGRAADGEAGREAEAPKAPVTTAKQARQRRARSGRQSRPRSRGAEGAGHQRGYGRYRGLNFAAWRPPGASAARAATAALAEYDRRGRLPPSAVRPPHDARAVNGASGASTSRPGALRARPLREPLPRLLPDTAPPAPERRGRLPPSAVRPAEGGPYSHSMVAGGFDEMSSTTRFTSGISLMMREETVSSRS